ncbi:hypothetical protein AB0G02_23065 [Actinosynnema sp. NPDC023658]|uniref:hypothetical protein n=1 Tax=Actinosynnema sp. NPDC023658 TaxID=3155465 RepID=UPI0033C8146E
MTPVVDVGTGGTRRVIVGGAVSGALRGVAVRPDLPPVVERVVLGPAPQSCRGVRDGGFTVGLS